MSTLTKRVVVMIIVSLLALVGLTVKSNAAVGTTLSSNDKLTPGSTVTINLSVAEDVHGINTTLKFDKNIFEYEVNAAGVNKSPATDAGTSATIANDVLVIEHSAPMKAGVIGTITLKVKEGITAKEATVSISSGEASDKDRKTVPLADAAITFKASETAVQETNTTKNEVTPVAKTENNTTAGNAAAATKTTNNTLNNITTSKATTKILKAGDGTTVMIISVVGLVAVIAIFGFVKYSNLKRDIK